jgi:hypothetical protein
MAARVPSAGAQFQTNRFLVDLSKRTLGTLKES